MIYLQERNGIFKFANDSNRLKYLDLIGLQDKLMMNENISSGLNLIFPYFLARNACFQERNEFEDLCIRNVVLVLVFEP